MTQEKRKLIEVAVPLAAINAACKADKDRKTGTVRNLHKWFAPMPTPAWRALLFASLVDDPGEPAERERLWRLIEELVASGPMPPPDRVLSQARDDIARCSPEGLPLVVDPFCGGGSTILEAQRLGLPALASDLNPVPVLITRFLCALLPATAGYRSLSGDTSELELRDQPFAGFCADARHYAALLHDEVAHEIGQHYPPGPDGEKPYAWLWARTAHCPSPACGAETILTTSWWLSRKQGEKAWVDAYLGPDGVVRTRVVRGESGPSQPTKVGRGGTFRCIACGSPIGRDVIREQGEAHKLGQRLVAVAALDRDSRVFLDPTAEQEEAALACAPDVDLSAFAITDGGNRERYGMSTYQDLFTGRQLTALEAFSRAVRALPERLEKDGADPAYNRALTTFFGLLVGKLAQSLSTQARWKIDSRNGTGKALPAFGRHDIAVTWDFVEVNPLGSGAGSWLQGAEVALFAIPFAVPGEPATVVQADARAIASDLPRSGAMVATDPPYFAHIAYADLSDYFYLWLRRTLKDSEPDLFSTVLAPRAGELVALPQRHQGDPRAAYEYFVEGFREVFQSLHGAQRPDLPLLVVYAHREEDGGTEGVGGWSAMLDAIMRAGHQIVGTLPIHATGAQRMVSLGANALATYVVMVCRPRAIDAQRIERRALDRVMRAELREAVSDLQRASITPVDLAQAVIGPGMAIFSRYREVLESDGRAMSVGGALQLINRMLGEVLDEQETDLDAESRWAAAWFEEHGYETGAFGEADALSRAKGIAVDTLHHAGIIERQAGKVRILRRDELDAGWTPASDARPTAWEAVQHLMRRLDDGGEAAAALLYTELGRLTEPARELAYRLFLACDRLKLTDEAVAVNGLVRSWTEIARLGESLPVRTGTQEAFFEA